ncbi:MAG: trimethylamine methyltransferase family protein [Armatimonadota bacterium]
MPILTDEQIRQINEASLDVLATVGVRLHHEQVVKRLGEAGADADAATGTVKLPPAMVAEYLQQCPRQVRLCDPQGGETVLTAGGPSVFWTGNAMHFVRGRERRELVSDDFVDICRVVNTLDNVHAIVGPSMADLPPTTRDFMGFRVMAERTSGKHLRPCVYTPMGIQAIIEMAEVLLGGTPLRERPIFSLGYTAVSPLAWSETALELFVVTSGHRIPMMVNSEPTAGATAPITQAGALVTANAEALSGVIIAQVLEPGRPCVFNLGFMHPFDMKYCVALTGSPENALMHAAGADIAAFHGLPSASWMSTEAKMADSQAAHEKTLTGLMDALHGATIIWGVGNLEGTLSMCLEEAVIDNEIVGLIRRAVRGFEVGAETMAAEAIKETGFQSGFLEHDHTLEHYRAALHFPDLLSRQAHEVWSARGAQSLEEAATERVREILAQPPPEPHLSDEQIRRLDALADQWRERIVG